MGGDLVNDPLGGVGAIEEMEDDNDDEEDNKDDKDNKYEDEYDAEEEAYLNQFINKDSVVSKGQTGHQVGQFFRICFDYIFFYSNFRRRTDLTDRQQAREIMLS